MIESTVRHFRKGLRALERQVELALAEQTKCCGVTPAQCHLILELEEASESSVGELAETLELDASTLSRTVDGLVRSGLAERREDPSNRRRQLVSLSLAGLEKAAGINALCDRYYEGLLSGLAEPQLRLLVQALPALVETMRAARSAAPDSGGTLGPLPSCCAPQGLAIFAQDSHTRLAPGDPA